MNNGKVTEGGWRAKVVFFLAEKSTFVIIISLIITGFLLYPLLQMSPSEQASPNPPGEVYDLQADIDSKFPSPVHFAYFMLEARSGDVLTSDVLLEFKENRDQLHLLDSKGELAVGTLEKQSYLYTYFNPDIGVEITGISSILEPLEIALSSMDTTLDTASEEQIKFAIHELLANENTSYIIDFLSQHARYEKRSVLGQEINWWTSPAMDFSALADNSKLGGAGLEIGLGGGPDVINKEHLNRKISTIMRGKSKFYETWGVAIDANLESQDEGRTSAAFITFTIIGAVLVVGLSLRSYWAAAISGIGLGMLMIWLKGISALVGLKGGLTVDLIVPISMISLGVDFVVHSVHRYKEETATGYSPRNGLKIGLAGVLAALLLAMVSDSIAFLSNLSSSIEAVIHFGSAAAIAVLSAFIILGIVAPIAIMRIDELIQISGKQFKGKLHISNRMFSSVGVASVSGGAVIIMIAVNALYGVIALILAGLIFIGFPAAYLARSKNKTQVERQVSSQKLYLSSTSHGVTAYVEKIVTTATAYSPAVLIITAVITAASVFFALKLEPIFDVKDFFDPRSDMVIGLDKVDEHVGEKGGEPGIAYIKGDLTDPDAVLAISDFIESLRDIDNIAERPSGEVTIGLNLVNVLSTVMKNPTALAAIKADSGIVIEDKNEDQIPDSKKQIDTIFAFARKNGVPGPDGNLILRPDQVKGAIYHSDGEKGLTTIAFQIPGTRDQAVVTKAGKAIRPILEDLESHPSISIAKLTGSPFTRELQLYATTRTLYTSLPIALAAATLLLIMTMRSFQYALVTVIPIGLVVAWLYGIMYITGFSLNFVTAMIGAISIGVGIDYSIHMTQRFREELKRNPSRVAALKRTSRGTGVALLASAASSIVGFVILGFAPMPMFASYGQLTAVMIFLALIASLIILPCLLMFVTKESEAVGKKLQNQGKNIDPNS
jgi:predicted RND superfamily exporter protein